MRRSIATAPGGSAARNSTNRRASYRDKRSAFETTGENSIRWWSLIRLPIRLLKTGPVFGGCRGRSDPNDQTDRKAGSLAVEPIDEWDRSRAGRNVKAYLNTRLPRNMTRPVSGPGCPVNSTRTIQAPGPFRPAGRMTEPSYAWRPHPGTELGRLRDSPRLQRRMMEIHAKPR